MFKKGDIMPLPFLVPIAVAIGSAAATGAGIGIAKSIVKHRK